jgi:hypothetical protein
VANEAEWAEMKAIPMLSNLVSVKHFGQTKTMAKNESGAPLQWTAKIPGIHSFLYIDGRKVDCGKEVAGRSPYSFYTLVLREGESATVSVAPESFKQL